LIYSDLRHINITKRDTSMTLVNINMTGTQLDSTVWFSEPIFWYERLANVVLPNGTWLVDETILVIFDDAEYFVRERFEDLLKCGTFSFFLA
jgi:hypothetical protein